MEVREKKCQISQNVILQMKFQSFTCVFTILVKFDIHFLGLLLYLIITRRIFDRTLKTYPPVSATMVFLPPVVSTLFNFARQPEVGVLHSGPWFCPNFRVSRLVKSKKT